MQAYELFRVWDSLVLEDEEKKLREWVSGMMAIWKVKPLVVFCA